MTPDLYIAKTELLKQYERQFDLLIENLDTIESELAIVHMRLTRMELLKELQKEKP